MTTTPDAFLRAICAAPADDAPRLVFADWLEENAGAARCGRCVELIGQIWGEGSWETCPDCRGSGRVSDGRREWAEFIRVQCELARVSHDGTEGDHDCPTCARLDALRRRERELWQGPARNWFDLPSMDFLRSRTPGRGDYNTRGRLMPAIVRRGFVAEVRLRVEDWCGRECENCAGDDPTLDERGMCPLGCTAGRRDTLGRRLVQVAPIERLTLTRHNARDTTGWTSSDAALAWARQVAGLPALERKETRRE